MASMSKEERLARTCPRTVFCSSARTRFSLRAVATTTGANASLRASNLAGSTTGVGGLAFAFFSTDFFGVSFSGFTASTVCVDLAATSAVVPARSLAKMSSTSTPSFLRAGATTASTVSTTGTSSTSGSTTISGMSTDRRPRPNNDTTFVCVGSDCSDVLTVSGPADTSRGE